MTLQLKDILELRGIDTSRNIRVVRHQDSRLDLRQVYQNGELDIYQAIQSRSVFDGAEYLVSFLGIENTKALFIGLFECKGKKRLTDLSELPPSHLYQKELEDQYTWYDLKRINLLDDFKDRLIIKWGSPSSTRSWVQKKLDKDVMEILPEGYVRDFPGYEDFILTYAELVKLIKNPDPNREWYNRLSSIAGIYLIVDTTTGKQYVGSASGKRGIWGRWVSYVKTGHGGNKQLREWLEADPSNVEHWQFTILRTLPISLTKPEVIEIENLYKQKLGSRDFGLNPV